MAKKRRRKRRSGYEPAYLPVPMSWGKMKKTYRAGKRLKRAIAPSAITKRKRLQAKIRELKAEKGLKELQQEYKLLKKARPTVTGKLRAKAMKYFSKKRKSIYD